MSYMGHILCRTCKLKLCLGKLHRDESRQPVGFAYAGISTHELGAGALHFMAMHLEHDLIVAGDEVVLEMDLREYDNLSMKVSPGEIAIVRLPCEPRKERDRRLKAGWIHPTDRGAG